MKTNPTEAEAGSVKALRNELRRHFDCPLYIEEANDPVLEIIRKHFSSPVLAEPEAQKASEEKEADHKATYVRQNWLTLLSEKAEKNISKWGLQDIETLGLAIAEECGELAQAILKHKSEGGPRSAIGMEAYDLGALCLQVLAFEDTPPVGRGSSLIAPRVTPNSSSPSTAAGGREEGICPRCKGRGMLSVPFAVPIKCSECNGTGSVPPVNVEPQDLVGKDAR